MLEHRRVLFVEDDKQEIETISKLLKLLKAEFCHVSTVNEALRELSTQSYDYVLTDLHIETKAGVENPDGLTVIRSAMEQQPQIMIVATSSDPRTEVVNEALAAGALHFIRKPVGKPDEIEIAFKLAAQRRILTRDAQKSQQRAKSVGLWESYSKLYPYGIIQGDREQKLAKLCSRKKASCVITGETGTGKEEAAKLIHRLRVELEGPIPFVAVNCATITGNLAESLLFGHKKGAFTGADEASSGYIAEADGGILFLDEIQYLALPVQQKLLRVLNDGTYHRLGETKTHRSEFQLIAATTKDLGREVDEGRFLVDLQMRMMGIDFTIPPLRERIAELPAFVALFFSRKGVQLETEAFDAIVKKLSGFRWPGNIRQLMKCLEAWLLYCELDEVPLAPGNFPVFKDLESQVRENQIADSVHMAKHDFNALLDKDCELEQLLEDFEREYLRRAMVRHESIGSLSKAINVPRSTLDSRRRKLGLM